MTSKFFKQIFWAGMLAAVLCASGLVPSVNAQQSANEARRHAYSETDKDRKAYKLERYNSAYAEYASKCRKQAR